MQDLPPELNSFISPLLDGSLIIGRLRVIEILLLIVFDIMVKPYSLDLYLLDLQLEISLMTVFRLGVLIYAGIFGQVFGKRFSCLVDEVSVFFLHAG